MEEEEEEKEEMRIRPPASPPSIDPRRMDSHYYRLAFFMAAKRGDVNEVSRFLRYYPTVRGRERGRVKPGDTGASTSMMPCQAMRCGVLFHRHGWVHNHHPRLPLYYGLHGRVLRRPWLLPPLLSVSLLGLSA